jgi:hypothetical protein
VKRDHKTIESVLGDVARSLYAGYMENLIRSEYKTEQDGKKLFLTVGNQKFILMAQRDDGRQNPKED